MEAYASLCLNLLCLSIYLLDTVLNIIFLSWRVFWTYEERSWNRVQFIFLCCFVIDWILLLAQVISGNGSVSLLFLLAIWDCIILTRLFNLSDVCDWPWLCVKQRTLDTSLMWVMLLPVHGINCMSHHLHVLLSAIAKCVNNWLYLSLSRLVSS